MNTDLDSELPIPEAERKTLTNSMSRASSLVTFVLVFCVAAGIGTWCLSPASKRTFSNVLTLRQRFAGNLHSRILEIQQENERQMQDAIESRIDLPDVWSDSDEIIVTGVTSGDGTRSSRGR